MAAHTYWAWVKTTLPPDEIETDGEVRRQDGLGIAMVVSGVWARMGLGSLSLQEAGEHGWQFTMGRGEIGVWTQISSYGDGACLLAVEDQTRGWKRPWRPFAEKVLAEFGQALKADPRIVDLKWLDPDNVSDDLSGFDSPTNPALLELYERKWGQR